MWSINTHGADTDVTASAIDAEDVTPSDSATLNPTRAIYIGTAGNIKVQFKGGGVVTFIAPAVGTVHPWQVIKVFATGGTTATNIVALY